MSKGTTETIEHIEPKKGLLVCGLDVPSNIVTATHSYNSRKQNRFVPYRINTHQAPSVFGDVCEFLISGEWVVCEFGGDEWWQESNKIGCGSTANNYVMTDEHREINREAATKLAAVRGEKFFAYFQKHSLPLTSEPVMVTTPDGDVYFFSSKGEAAERFKLHRTMLSQHLRGKRKHVKGYIVSLLPKHLFYNVL